MNRPVRTTAAVLLSLFAVLSVAVGYQQAVAGDRYREDFRNRRTVDERTSGERGSITTAEGEVVARSVPTGDPDHFRREYPWADLYAHAVGYSSPLFGDTGIEAAEADRLRPVGSSGIGGLLASIFGGGSRTHDVKLTIRHDLQLEADAAIGDRRGAIVALDPETGAVLALVSSPSFDPNELLDPYSTAAGDDLTADPSLPLLDRSTREVYAPGSTFKVITAAAALQNDVADADTELPDTDELLLPGSSAPIRNAGDGFCADGASISLEEAIVVSCNTAFATLGTMVGAEALIAAAKAAGFDDAPPFSWEVAESRVPPAEELEDDLPALAQNAIGERDVRATPLQMALVAAGVANAGVVMRPYLVDRVTTATGEVVDTAVPTRWRTAFEVDTAAELERMMEQVVVRGTGTAAAVPGLRVSGKTGTAHDPSGAPIVWFIGSATPEGDPEGPSIAIAVVFESGGGLGDEGSGGRVAAPAAARVLEAWRDSLP